MKLDQQLNKSKSHKIELYVILFVLFVIVFSEVFIRIFQDELSGDIRHINSIEAISKDLVSTEGTSILFLGNSLIGDGINPEVLKEELKSRSDSPVNVGKIVPDGTNLMDWYYIIKNKIVVNDINPDILVIGYAWHQLADNHEIFPKRLGAHFCNLSDFPELLTFGLSDFGKQSEFFISKISAVFSNSSTIRNHSLDLFIPNYRKSTQLINEFQKKIPKNSNVQKLETSYVRLQHFLNMLKENNTRAVVIAMPILEPYDIDPKMQNLIEKYGMQFYDCRETTGIAEDKFVDTMHLGEEGSQIFSRYLANRVLSKNLDIFNKH